MPVSSTGADDSISFKVEARGVNARLAAHLPAPLAGEAEDSAIDARAIQPYSAVDDGDTLFAVTTEEVEAPGLSLIEILGFDDATRAFIQQLKQQAARTT